MIDASRRPRPRPVAGHLNLANDQRPLYVYDNWSAYDELSDAISLDEKLALFELEQVQRLKQHGVQFDAYLMDAFWYEPSGEYLQWRKESWPDGPDRWLDTCKVVNVLPGLWFPANTSFTLEAPESWKDSLSEDGWSFCCFCGGFLAGFIDVLDYWYRKGVRVFKFDFADFGAAPESIKRSMLPSEIRQRNISAYRAGLKRFRSEHPEAWLLAYNGFEEGEFMPWTDRPVRRVVDPEWLDIFDTIYCGDPRPADTPLPDFWRTLDVYAGHQLWFLNQGGLPLRRIDNCAFMLGKTGTCYWRGVDSWKSTALLSYASGCAVHVAMGNLELLSDEDATWLSKSQSLCEGSFAPKWLGDSPGQQLPYGLKTEKFEIWVNPSLKSVPFPISKLPIAFSDGLANEPASMLSAGAVIAFAEDIDLGRTGKAYEFDEVDVEWHLVGISAVCEWVVEPGNYWFGFQQFDHKGLVVRSCTGSGKDSPSLTTILKVSASMGEQNLEITTIHDRVIWSGISWALATAQVKYPGILRVFLSSSDPNVKQIVPFLLVEKC